MSDEASNSSGEPETEPVEDSSEQSSSTPTQIQRTNNALEYDDITVQDNGQHRALIELHYRRYFIVIIGSLITIFGVLFATGIIPMSVAETISAYGTGLLIPLFIIVFLFDSRANS